MIWGRRNWERLNQMLDEGIRGEFEESKYDESELSKVESKWKRFLQDSAMAKQNLETEKANIKGLISAISHQTKTPMANIKLDSELLSEQLEEDGMEAELLGQIQAQAQKLEFLIQALTKLSRLETNILEVVPVKSRVKPLLESAVEEIRKKAEKKETKKRVSELIKLIGLEGLEKRYPSQLSGGQKLRVVIARALIAKPRIVFADEPTGNLDTRTGEDTMRLLMECAAEFGQTLIVVTHNPEIAQKAQQVIRIEDGQILKGEPQHEKGNFDTQ